jgi:general secretion pathway protein K
LKPLHNKGFALAAALWLLAGLAIVVSLVNDAAVSSAERVRQLRERADFVRSSLATRANMLYFLSLSTSQAAGFSGATGMILADETPYKLDPLSVVRIQDLGGLVNLNSFERQIMERFLQSCGVESDQILFLIDTLEDYTDEDDLQRINGAEKLVYGMQSKPPPRNARLLSVEEIWQVHGWEKYKQSWAINGCARALTTHQGNNSSVNLATAPATVLRAMGLDEATAADLVAARSSPEKTAERTELANAQTGNTGMFGSGGGSVKGDLRVTHEHATLPWVMAYNFKFDLTSNDKPWSFSQPVISARLHSPVLPSSSALPWPKNGALPPSTSDNKPVLPF